MSIGWIIGRPPLTVIRMSRLQRCDHCQSLTHKISLKPNLFCSVKILQTHLGIFYSLERVRGVEPLSSAWKAEVIPLYDTRNVAYFTKNIYNHSMVDKERLRELFGRLGDVDTDTPEGIEELTRNSGIEPVYVNELVTRALENAIEIDCDNNQKLLFRYLDSYTGIKKGDWPSNDEEWQIDKHMETCHNPICQRLNQISIWDKHLDGDEMKHRYGAQIEYLRKKSG